MAGVKSSAFAFFGVLLVVIGFIFIVSASSDVMTVEADIFYNGNVGGNASMIKVDVPDYLFFGNVSIGSLSQEMKVYINNTGNVDITVTPRLVNTSEEIFSYLNFRKLKTTNGTAVPFTRIGDFSFDIDKPDSGDSYKSTYIYMSLDLRNYSGPINYNIKGHRSDVKFFAAER